MTTTKEKIKKTNKQIAKNKKTKEKDDEAKELIAMNKKIKKQINKANKLALMNAIKDIKEKERLKQKEIAALLDIKQPRVSDLLNLKYKRFSIDILINYLIDFGFIMNFEKVDTNKGRPIKSTVLKKDIKLRNYYQ